MGTRKRSGYSTVRDGKEEGAEYCTEGEVGGVNQGRTVHRDIDVGGKAFEDDGRMLTHNRTQAEYDSLP